MGGYRVGVSSHNGSITSPGRRACSRLRFPDGEVLIARLIVILLNFWGGKVGKYDLGKLDFLGWFCFTTLQM